MSAHSRATVAAQAAIGYTQYFTRVPAYLVVMHLTGATALWIAVLLYNLGLFVHPAPAPCSHQNQHS